MEPAKKEYKDYEYMYVRFMIMPDELESDPYNLYGNSETVVAPSSDSNIHHCRLVAKNAKEALEIGRQIVPKKPEEVELFKEVAIKI